MLHDTPHKNKDHVEIYLGSHHHTKKDRLTYCAVIERHDKIGAYHEIYENAAAPKDIGGAKPAGYFKALLLALENIPEGTQIRINSDQSYVTNYCGMSDFEREFAVICLPKDEQESNALSDALKEANQTLKGITIPSRLITEENTAEMRVIDLANDIAALTAPHQQRRSTKHASTPRHGSSADALTIIEI